MKQLSPKEQRFVDEYLIDLDPQRAAIAAGYSETTARVKSYGWVAKPEAKPHIYEAVRAAKQARAERLELDAGEVLHHALQLATYDVRQIFDSSGQALPPHKLPAEMARVVQGVQRGPDGGFQYRLPDRNAATERLVKHLGLYEQDNRQKRDPIAELMEQISGSAQVLDAARKRSGGFKA